MEVRQLLLNHHLFTSGAIFSECRKYRYCLWRIWDEKLPLVMFIGLNPSTANEETNDATIRRVIQFARHWKYGGVYMMNCFPFVSTNPDDLKDCNNLEQNDLWLGKAAALCKDIVFAWGAFDIVKKSCRDIELKKKFPNAKALVINKDGTPRHPLYVPANISPVNYQ